MTLVSMPDRVWDCIYACILVRFLPNKQLVRRFSDNLGRDKSRPYHGFGIKKLRK